MPVTRRPLTLTAATALLAVLFLLACASGSYIKVRYQLPPRSNSLQGRQVFVAVEDRRTQRDIFDPSAREEFKYFTGLFALTLAYGDEKGLVTGTYDLPALFAEAMQRRLRHAGVQTLAAAQAGQPVMQIDLQDFTLKLEKRRWVATVAYTVSLTKDNRTVAKDEISGTAERVKVVGSGAAEKVLGDIFSDIVNRLELSNLFQQAGL